MVKHLRIRKEITTITTKLIPTVIVFFESRETSTLIYSIIIIDATNGSPYMLVKAVHVQNINSNISPSIQVSSSLNTYYNAV